MLLVVDWMGLNMVPLCCACAPAPSLSGEGFSRSTDRKEMAAATAGSAPAKEVVEKKVELMKEVFSTSQYFHTSNGVSCSSLRLREFPVIVL